MNRAVLFLREVQHFLGVTSLKHGSAAAREPKAECDAARGQCERQQRIAKEAGMDGPNSQFGALHSACSSGMMGTDNPPPHPPHPHTHTGTSGAPITHTQQSGPNAEGGRLRGPVYTSNGWHVIAPPNLTPGRPSEGSCSPHSVPATWPRACSDSRQGAHRCSGTTQSSPGSGERVWLCPVLAV